MFYQFYTLEVEPMVTTVKLNYVPRIPTYFSSTAAVSLDSEWKNFNVTESKMLSTQSYKYYAFTIIYKSRKVQ